MENSINIYATIAHGRYALRALALYESMKKHLDHNLLFILCLDNTAWESLKNLNLKNCRVLHSDSVEIPLLLKLKKERAAPEYCWTCKSFVLELIFSEYKNVGWAIYLDSDTMVFGDPDHGLPEDPESHVLLTPHRPTDEYFLSHIKTAGIYNAGYIAFRNSEEGKTALSWWKKKCVEACPMIPQEGIYADQYYLNYMPELFNGIMISTNKGLNAAPWNISGQVVTKHIDKVFIADDELLTYHMQGVEIFTNWIIDNYKGTYVMPKTVRQYIYKPYAFYISLAWKKIKKNVEGDVRLSDVGNLYLRFVVRHLLKILSRKSNLCISILD